MYILKPYVLYILWQHIYDLYTCLQCIGTAHPPNASWRAAKTAWNGGKNSSTEFSGCSTIHVPPSAVTKRIKRHSLGNSNRLICGKHIKFKVHEFEPSPLKSEVTKKQNSQKTRILKLFQRAWPPFGLHRQHLDTPQIPAMYMGLETMYPGSPPTNLNTW